ncbi:MAG: beta-galactosidase [Treponemataceae bacterium]|nr:beta-galactosidase [Treponemataceae bacterium]
MAEYSFTPEYLTKNGKPWFPIMGEMHYSRYPEKYWKESLCKMKAGGVELVSTYVIWIHHEEIEGSYDFSGDRDLRAFAAACRDCGVKLLLRIGPWCHGEVRNGGFPDWLLKKPFETRTNNDEYFACVEKWYSKIYSMVSGFLSTSDKSDNTIIGVQIENEYGHCGGLNGEEGERHMKKLLEIARKVGFNVPLYTATGWGGAVTGGLIPVMGGYCDAPWDPRTRDIEPSGNYIFTHERNDHNIGSDHGFGEGITFDMSKFPFLTAELGGGLQMTYHRRTEASSTDIGAMSLVKLGSGVNLLGYYMYHGGTNPNGKLTTLQESKATGSPNDLPVKSYDFRAPIREYGQVSDTLRELKLLTYFVHDFNDEICLSKAVIPEDNPLDPKDLSHLRYSFRTNGESGWLFVNNYVRRRHTANHKAVRIPVPSSVCDEGLSFPSLDINDGDYFFLPFNMKCGTSVIETAEVTPFCRINNSKDGDIFVFYARRNVSSSSDFFRFKDDSSASEADLREASKKELLVLSRKDALNAWKTASGELIITDGVLIQNEFSEDILIGKGNARFAAYPPLKKLPSGFIRREKVQKNLYKGGKEFFFEVYESDPFFSGCVIPECIYASEAEVIKGGKKYRVDISSVVNFLKSDRGQNLFDDCFLRFYYEGNKARLYGTINGERKLLADNFFSGSDFPWEIGLKRFLSLNTDFSSLELEIDELSKKDDIFFESPVTFVNGTICRLLCTGIEYEWSCCLQID